MPDRSDRVGSAPSLVRQFVPSYQGVGPVLVGLLFSLALLCTIFPHLHGRQAFPDMVAGYLAFHGGDKTQDYRAILLLIAMMLVLPPLVAAVARVVAPGGHRSANGRAVQQLLLLSLVPAAWRLAVDAAVPSQRVPRLSFGSMFPLAALFGLALLARYRRTLRPAHVLTTGGAVVLALCLSTFVGYATGVFFVRLIPGMFHVLGDRGATLANGCVWISVAGLSALMVWSPTVELFQARVLRWLQGMQYPIVLLFFFLVPPRFIDPQHRFNDAYPAVLVAVLALGVVASWACMRRRFGTDAPDYLGPVHRHPLARALAPAAVTAVLVFVYCGAVSWPGLVTDDFQWGEQAVAWPALVQFHQVPYVDFVPIHGLMSYLLGGFNAVFFDGTADTYSQADVLLVGLSAIALGFSASMVVTPLGALVLLGGLVPVNDRIYFYVPAFLFLAAPQVVRRPARLVWVWVVVSVLLMAYNPTQGPAFAVATLPVGLWGSWRAFRTERAAFGRIVLAVAAVAGLTLAVPVARHVCVGFVAFVADNAFTNVVAHAIPWVDGREMHVLGWGPNLTQFLWEVIRSFWFLAAFICVAIFWKRATGALAARGRPPAASGPRPASTATVLILTGTFPVYLWLWSPWTAGRLIPGIMTYPGDVSQTCLMWVVPVLVLLTVNRRLLPAALLAVAVVSGFLYPSNPTRIDPDRLAGKAVAARVVATDRQRVIDGNAIGMPRLGRVVDSPVFQYLNPIHDFLTRFLRPGETYLDMTNRTALYYYLGLPCPVRYSAFVAANTRMQAGMLRQLDEHPVPAVLLAPSIMLDMVSTEFRNYFIYRRYATTFSVVANPAYTFLVDPARGAALSPPAAPVGTEAHAAGVDAACFYMDTLEHLPAAFGESWDRLGPMFSHVADVGMADRRFTHSLTVTPQGDLIPTGPNPYVEFALPPEAASGRRADFLLLRFSYDPTPVPHEDPPPHPLQLGVCWVPRGLPRYSKSFRFDAPTGRLLIPLGAYPRWLLADDLITIRFDLLWPERARSFKFQRMEFVHLEDRPSP